VSTRRAYISEIDKILRHLHQFVNYFDIYYHTLKGIFKTVNSLCLSLHLEKASLDEPNLNLLMQLYPSNDISNVANKID
jgi:hypothetical protein